MRKEEHIKIVNELQLKIKELEKQNVVYQSFIDDFRFLKDEYRDKLDEMAEDLYSKDLLITVYKKNIKDLTERIIESEKKQIELLSFLKDTFPFFMNNDTILENDVDLPPDISDDVDLSSSFIGENGKIYSPMNVIDMAMFMLKMQNEQIKKMGGNFFDGME